MIKCDGNFITTESSEKLKKDLLNTILNLENLTLKFENEIKELQRRESEWDEVNQKTEKFLNKNIKNYPVIKINVGGKLFATKLETLLSVKNTLFFKLILCEKFDLTKEIFIDRSPRFFSVILDYLRYKKISFERFSETELIDLKYEADFYEIGTISDYLNEKFSHKYRANEHRK
jgi:hypothetical protein